MSAAIVASTPYDDILTKGNCKMFKSMFADRKPTGPPLTALPISRRNSGPTSTTTNTTNTSTILIINKLDTTSSPLSLNDATTLLSNNQGHRKLDRSLSEPVERSTCSALANQQQQQQQQQQQRNNQGNSSRYKTELCRPFEESGTCKYGDKCQFAHGGHELRTLARHPKYKTELCRTFHTTGFCPYGPRCHFIHNADESRRSVCGGGTNHGGGGSSSPPPLLSRDVQRPKALTIASYSLGSTGDSSNCSGSPTSLDGFDDPYPSTFSYPASTPATPTTIVTANNAFSYSQDFTSLRSLVNEWDIKLLSQAMNKLKMNKLNRMYDSADNNVFRDPNPVISHGIPGPEAPPSPEGSLCSDLDNQLSSLGSVSPTCSSPLDVSRNLRLPIFTAIANATK